MKKLLLFAMIGMFTGLESFAQENSCPVPTGSYSKSCPKCNVTDKCYLNCTCLDSHYAPRSTTINLSTQPKSSDGKVHLQNSNGQLRTE